MLIFVFVANLGCFVTVAVSVVVVLFFKGLVPHLNSDLLVAHTMLRSLQKPIAAVNFSFPKTGAPFSRFFCIFFWVFLEEKL